MQQLTTAVRDVYRAMPKNKQLAVNPQQMSAHRRTILSMPLRTGLAVILRISTLLYLTSRYETDIPRQGACSKARL